MSEQNTNIPVEILMEEYKQLYEHARHENATASSKEGIFVAIAFGILAYAFEKQLLLCQLCIAGFFSVVIYLYHTLSCERLAFDYSVRYKRSTEIEGAVTKIAGPKILCFQTNREEYEKCVKEERRKNRHWYDPYSWVARTAECVRIGCIRVAVAIILILLWGIVIYDKWYTQCSSVQSVP